MRVKLTESQKIGALEIYRADRVRPLITLLRWARNCFISCFPTRLILWADFYVYLKNSDLYVPYSQYKRNIAFYDSFEFQQCTRDSNVKNMPSVGCLE